MILIDLQKAFDTIDHKKLIEKMKCMGFSNDVTKWFKFYLSKKMFSVHVENSFSDFIIIIIIIIILLLLLIISPYK